MRTRRPVLQPRLGQLERPGLGLDGQLELAVRGLLGLDLLPGLRNRERVIRGIRGRGVESTDFDACVGCYDISFTCRCLTENNDTRFLA